MESLPLIDVSSEDDLLISASSDAIPDRPSSGLSENHIENKTVSGQEGEGPIKISKRMEQVLELSESPEQKRVKSSKYNLRKSLAWDSAFFTSEGVLNPEELAIVNSTFRKAEASSLPGIPEDTRKSTESTSTLDSETLVLENLEEELFENVRVSIQKSLGKYENPSNAVDSGKAKKHGQLDAPCVGSSKRVESLSQNKKKTAIASKRHVVSKKHPDHTSEPLNIAKVATNKSAESKPSLKPPRVLSRATLPAVPKKSAFGSGNIQSRSSTGKASSGNVINRQSVIVSTKINGHSSSVNSKSIRSPKATSGSPSRNPVLSATSCSSHSGSPSSSSDSMVKAPSVNARERVASRNVNESSSGSTTKRAPVKASKYKTMSRNENKTPLRPKSTFKFSANASPNSSFDSMASESSSSASVTMKPSKLRDSLDTGSLSSSPSLAGPENLTFCSSGSGKISTGHPYVRSESISKDSSEIRVISEQSIGNDFKRCTNSVSGAKCIKPSGLRMPTPKIGYFDAEKSRNVETFSVSGQSRNLIRSTIRNGSPVGVNKLKPSNASTKFDPRRIHSTSMSSTRNVKPASRTCLQQPSKPSELGGTMRMSENHDVCSDVSKDLPPCSSEEGHSKVSKIASNPCAGEQASQEHAESVVENESVASNSNAGNSISKGKTYEQGELHSVTRSIEEENLFPDDKTDGRSKNLQDKNLNLPVLELLEEKVSSLSLSNEQST